MDEAMTGNFVTETEREGEREERIEAKTLKEIPRDSSKTGIEDINKLFITLSSKYEEFFNVPLPADACTRAYTIAEVFDKGSVDEVIYFCLMSEFYGALQAHTQRKIIAENDEKLNLGKATEGISHLIEATKAAKEAIKGLESAVNDIKGEKIDFAELVKSSSSTLNESVSLASKMREIYTGLPEKLSAALDKELPIKLEEALVPHIAQIVDRKASELQQKTEWFNACARNTFFLFGFGVFGSIFFLAGMLSVAGGMGVPAWVAPKINANAALYGTWDLDFLLSTLLGLRMSWMMWIGGGFLSVLWIYEHRKQLKNVQMKDFVSGYSKYLLFAVIAIVILVAFFVRF